MEQPLDHPGHEHDAATQAGVEGFLWFQEHAPELVRTVGGQWVAVRDGRVVASAASFGEAAAAARGRCAEGMFVGYVPTPAEAARTMIH